MQAALAGLLASACDAGLSPPVTGQPPAMITSSREIDGLTAQDFQTMCDERGGTVEPIAHCGGLATAAGFSYDTTTQTLAEHTCKGANTCAGWNCITDPLP